MDTARILIIEDDHDIAQLIALHLREVGYGVDAAHDGETGFERASLGRYDLIVLDVVLPKLSGTELCQRLRAAGNYTLILMLTAKSAELDRVLGLELGADDYLSKPFSFRELQARVKALLRRKAQAEGTTRTLPSVIRVNDLSIDVENRAATFDGRSLPLTLKEFELLVQFAQHPGRVYTRTQLLDLVWGYGYEGLEHTVNSHINRLRTKLERDPANPEYIQTVWGVGYRFTTALAKAVP
ncbi:MAG: Phosphate regulon transcriptional regulatory protein PhoB (SphR) [uncultured Truepera sp.]|uniref:Phosphate regulon transcriptional regulatory protein PhoB (SphR) n=1 Tax=uncultured Truepera sp. TaxID=543023 RepID=A0A6J4VR41_9DEIN|nr:MAG: Phosphate regulon transcriptional regulatory protein PhoB (SphR) [uncultured Truepera sp.]